MPRKNSTCDLASEGSFESYLSTVTKNGLGMLVVLAMASTFSSQLTLGEAKFRRDLGSPIMQEAPEESEWVGFECRNGRFFPRTNLEVIIPDMRQFADPFRPADEKELERLAREFNAKDYKHEFYTFEWKVRAGHPFLPDKPGVFCRPRRDDQGETLAEVQRPDSAFRQRLKPLKGKVVVFVRVWSDSFEVFRQFRDWLRAEGHDISWQPADGPDVLLHPFYYGGSGSVDK